MSTPGPTAGTGLQRVSLNGRKVSTAAPNLEALLLEHGHDLRSAFACAINTAFVPRSQWPQQRLCEGDRIDVVAPITGG
ncbi:MAG TPA: sulfur carrier protein ThiS [Rhizobacter sp.]|nr:sulfur carrier protein ThiS [Rhizobacter sp.]